MDGPGTRWARGRGSGKGDSGSGLASYTEGRLQQERDGFGEITGKKMDFTCSINLPVGLQPVRDLAGWEAYSELQVKATGKIYR